MDPVSPNHYYNVRSWTFRVFVLGANYTVDPNVVNKFNERPHRCRPPHRTVWMTSSLTYVIWHLSAYVHVVAHLSGYARQVVMATLSLCDNREVVRGTAKHFGRQFLSRAVDNVLWMASSLDGVNMGGKTKYKRGFAAVG